MLSNNLSGAVDNFREDSAHCSSVEMLTRVTKVIKTSSVKTMHRILERWRSGLPDCFVGNSTLALAAFDNTSRQSLRGCCCCKTMSVTRIL